MRSFNRAIIFWQVLFKVSVDGENSGKSVAWRLYTDVDKSDKRGRHVRSESVVKRSKAPSA